MITPCRPHGAVPEPDTTLLVIAKQPRPGRVKTRLVPPCIPGQAAALAELRVADLPRLRGVHTGADAVAVARQVPRSRLAARVRELAPVLGPAAAPPQAGGDVRELA